eukprot:scaffold3418_cov124-Isochrysis_galbana.AAC.34
MPETDSQSQRDRRPPSCPRYEQIHHQRHRRATADKQTALHISQGCVEDVELGRSRSAPEAHAHRIPRNLVAVPAGGRRGAAQSGPFSKSALLLRQSEHDVGAA